MQIVSIGEFIGYNFELGYYMQVNYLNRFKIPLSKVKKLTSQKYKIDTSKFVEHWEFLKECMSKELEFYDEETMKNISGFYISSVGDDRTCKDCANLNGKFITLESIRRGYGPPYHIDCRCTIIAIWKGEKIPVRKVTPDDFENMDWLRIADLETDNENENEE